MPIYSYDARSQLTKAVSGGTTYRYSYDSLGNILSAQTGTSNGKTTHTYTYGNAQWRDLLTAYDGREFYTYGIVPVDVVDTMGAGDSFIAGFLYAICAGKAVPEAMADGAKNSSVTLAYAGAW